jgi:Holliday junction DNA helicase RuvA
LIGFLRGRIAAKHPPLLVMDVDGVGYELEAPMSTFYGLAAVGAETTLHTHLVVREDAHILYGFGSERERALFRELIKVSNVGPRIALAILSGVSVDDFHRCVERDDVASLVRIPGIGRKTAERLVVEMRDRLKALADRFLTGDGTGGAPAVTLAAQSEAYGALIALGYKPAEVTRLLKAVDPSVTSTEEMIRHALRTAASA